MQFLKYLKKYWKVVIVLLFILLMLGVLTYSFISPNGYFAKLSNDLKVLEPLEGSAYTDLDGNPVDLSVFKGKPLIINAWATWIPFSQTELPLLVRLKNTHGDAIQIVAMNRMEQIGIVRSFLATFAIPQNTVVILSDPTDHFFKVVGGYAMPETLFYTSDGVLTTHKRGMLTEAELEEFTTAILEKE